MIERSALKRYKFGNSPNFLIRPSPVDEGLEIVKLLFHDTNVRMQNLRERTFKTTIQSVTLNLIALGGLIANKVVLTYAAKLLGSSLLISFNVVIIIYMYFKGTAFGRAKNELLIYKQELINKSPQVSEKVKLKKAGSFSFWSGSGILIVSIAVSGICTVLALWFQLTSSEQNNTIYQSLPKQLKIITHQANSSKIKIDSTFPKQR